MLRIIKAEDSARPSGATLVIRLGTFGCQRNPTLLTGLVMVHFRMQALEFNQRVVPEFGRLAQGNPHVLGNFIELQLLPISQLHNLTHFRRQFSQKRLNSNRVFLRHDFSGGSKHAVG
jgi:hypothetical protein